MFLVRALLSLLVVLGTAAAVLATWHRRYAEHASAAEAAILAQLAARGNVDAAEYAVEYADSSFGAEGSQLAVVPDAFVRSLRTGRWIPEPHATAMLEDEDVADALLPPPRQATIRTADGARYELMVYSAGQDRWTMHVQGRPAATGSVDSATLLTGR